MAWAGDSRSAGATAVAVMTLFGGMNGHDDSSNVRGMVHVH